MTVYQVYIIKNSFTIFCPHIRWKILVKIYETWKNNEAADFEKCHNNGTPPITYQIISKFICYCLCMSRS